jgi:chromosome segregation ATPase
LSKASVCFHPFCLIHPPYVSIILTTFRYPSFAEKIVKANEILKVNEDILVLKNEIEGLQKEREENLKRHEQYLKAIQETSAKEIEDLKAEISEKDVMLENWQDQHHNDKEMIKGLRAQIASSSDERKFVDSNILGKSQLSRARRNIYVSCIISDTVFCSPRRSWRRSH